MGSLSRAHELGKGPKLRRESNENPLRKIVSGGYARSVVFVQDWSATTASRRRMTSPAPQTPTATSAGSTGGRPKRPPKCPRPTSITLIRTALGR